MSKTLVTGGCGFIGAHLCAELVQNGESLGGQVVRPYESADVPKIEKLQRQGQRITFEARPTGLELPELDTKAPSSLSVNSRSRRASRAGTASAGC